MAWLGSLPTVSLKSRHWPGWEALEEIPLPVSSRSAEFIPCSCRSESRLSLLTVSRRLCSAPKRHPQLLAIWPPISKGSNRKSLLSLSYFKSPSLERVQSRASLVAQWLRIRLPMQGTRVRALVWEDPTCRGATRPVSHNYWTCASGACAPQQERPRQWEARAPRWRVAPACRNWRKPSLRNEDPTQQSINKSINL